MKRYNVYLDGQAVGKADVKTEGLYFKVCCRCTLPEDKIYRLTVACGKEIENLGICIPQGDCFGLDKRIPVKRMGEGELKFNVVARDSGQHEQFVPLVPNTAFDMLYKLDSARYQVRDGKPGLLILL